MNRIFGVWEWWWNPATVPTTTTTHNGVPSLAGASHPSTIKLKRGWRRCAVRLSDSWQRRQHQPRQYQPSQHTHTQTHYKNDDNDAVAVDDGVMAQLLGSRCVAWRRQRCSRLVVGSSRSLRAWCCLGTAAVVATASSFCDSCVLLSMCPLANEHLMRPRSGLYFCACAEYVC